MQAFKTKRSLFTFSGTLLLCIMVGSMVSACGQMGPLTLPQPPAEVAKPEKNNAQPSENATLQLTGERSGPL